ncbi:MAG: radical SAM protein [Candidatus Woesearchaeota archaeon]
MKLVRVTRESAIPLIGCIAFGVIDRGTDLLQIRPSSACNLNCAYCSTRSGDQEAHPVSYEVEKDYLVDYVKEVAKFKGEKVEANVDSVGETMLYKDIIGLISDLNSSKEVRFTSMQTNGCLISEEKLKKMEEAGMGRINLSINAVDASLAKKLSGIPNYDVDKIINLARMIANSKIELLLAPVWIPGLNDDEIPKLVRLAKELGCRIGIQKYETYKHSRKVKGVRPATYWKFYTQLREMEKEFDAKLVFSARDFGIHRAKRLPLKFEKGEKASLEVKAKGWWKGQMIAVGKNRCVTVNDCTKGEGDLVNVRVLENKNNIYVAKQA